MDRECFPAKVHCFSISTLLFSLVQTLDRSCIFYRWPTSNFDDFSFFTNIFDHSTSTLTILLYCKLFYSENGSMRSVCNCHVWNVVFNAVWNIKQWLCTVTTARAHCNSFKCSSAWLGGRNMCFTCLHLFLWTCTCLQQLPHGVRAFGKL